MANPFDEPAFKTSAELYAGCASADVQVQVSAYENLWRYLLRVATQMTWDHPAAEAMAQDCAQAALIRIHDRLAECGEPAAFHAWSRRIVANVCIDELRRQKRLVFVVDDEGDEPGERSPLDTLADPEPSPERTVLDTVSLAELRALIGRAPISERSARVVLGRYVDNLPDEVLAQHESRLSGQRVLPSHVQVTRTKDIARLRTWPPVHEFLRSAG